MYIFSTRRRNRAGQPPSCSLGSKALQYRSFKTSSNETDPHALRSGVSPTPGDSGFAKIDANCCILWDVIAGGFDPAIGFTTLLPQGRNGNAMVPQRYRNRRPRRGGRGHGFPPPRARRGMAAGRLAFGHKDIMRTSVLVVNRLPERDPESLSLDGFTPYPAERLWRGLGCSRTAGFTRLSGILPCRTLATSPAARRSSSRVASCE